MSQVMQTEIEPIYANVHLNYILYIRVHVYIHRTKLMNVLPDTSQGSLTLLFDKHKGNKYNGLFIQLDIWICKRLLCYTPKQTSLV